MTAKVNTEGIKKRFFLKFFLLDYVPRFLNFFLGAILRFSGGVGFLKKSTFIFFVNNIFSKKIGAT